MANIKNLYVASANMASTSLASLASSATLVAGGETAAYDNTSNLYLDVKLAGKIAVHATTPLTANTQIIVWVAAEISDAVWPDVLDGTDSAETWTNIQMRDASCKVAAIIDVVATTAGIVYPFDCASVRRLFGGVLPRKFVCFIAHNTGQTLAASGSSVSVMPSYQTVV